MDKVAVVMFDTDLHEISVPGSHYTLVVPGASNEEVYQILIDAEVSVWYEHYLVRAIRVLKEAGYEPIPLNGIVGINPHEREIYTVDDYKVHARSHKALEVTEVPQDEE